MRRTMTAITFGLVCLAPGMALAHGGGLDSSGCHTKRATGEYHCHRGNSAASNTNQQKEKTVSVQSDKTCHIGPRGGRYRIVNGKKRYGC